jgi:hypothetical protein
MEREARDLLRSKKKKSEEANRAKPPERCARGARILKHSEAHTHTPHGKNGNAF